MRLIGLISGTSVDSIDAACVEIEGEAGNYRIALCSYVSHPWNPQLRSAILDVCRPDAPMPRVTALNFLIGEAFAEASEAAATEAHWDLSTVDAIASHGQTIWHQPEPFSFTETDLTSVGTLQIGEAAVIAARTGCCVVSDFRVADMAIGGQGAPLVPFLDFALFANNKETRAIQNLGGIGNVTYLRAGGGLEDLLAFDTGPGNMLMDGISQLSTGKDRDDNGSLAAQGEVYRPLLVSLLSHPFFEMAPPRTTGREMFGREMAVRTLEQGRTLQLSDADILATCTALTAESIAEAYRKYLDPIARIECVVLGGGGIHNATLLAMLRKALSPARVTVHEEVRG